MAKWQRTLDVRDIWEKRDKGEISIQEMSKIMAERLNLLADFKDDDIDDAKESIIEEFECLSDYKDATVGDFDDILSDLYDWADTTLDYSKPFCERKKVCWVKTTF